MRLPKLYLHVHKHDVFSLYVAMLMATVIIYLAALIGIALMYAYFTEVCSIYFIHSYVCIRH